MFNNKKKKDNQMGITAIEADLNVTAPKEKLMFAKMHDDAIVPKKRKEDAGYDFFPVLEGRWTEEGVAKEQFLEKGKVSVVKTGIASSMSDKFFLSMNSERSSVAKLGLTVLAGVIDSGYQGEIMLMVVPLVKDIIITNMTKEVEDNGDSFLVPYTKAIAQGVLMPVPDVDVSEVSYEELTSKKTERGTGGWGSTDK